MKTFKLLIFFSFFVFGYSYAQNTEFIAGDSYFGNAYYIEYVAGNLPLIISVPHDGKLKPDFIPDRKRGSSNTDFGTRDIARIMYDYIVEKTGKYPHLIICHLARKKLDANRDEFEAAQNDQIALEAWNEYHSFIETAFAEVEKQYDRGFFVDLHGQRHEEQRIEIGYCLDYQLLLLPDEELNDEAVIDRSSLKNMLKFSNENHAQLIKGENSLGAIFDKYMVKSTPSPTNLNIEEDNYFSGGYTTFRHAVMYAGNISGVQLELNTELREPGNCESTALMLVDVITEYLRKQWDIDFFNANE